MLPSIRTYTVLIAFALLGSFIGTANRAQAQTYQIDCAILLCLSGGWPTSVPCTRAKAEFIRRITPWPIEPPLQIWRCPMGASYHPSSSTNDPGRMIDILFKERDRPAQMLTPANETPGFLYADLLVAEPYQQQILPGELLELVQERADIDISGPEFDFVRSIRVFDVYINDDRHDGNCDRYERVRIGSYGLQGDFSWQRTNRAAMPPAFGPTRSGCSLRVRAVFVEWRDYQGNYGFERVDY